MFGGRIAAAAGPCSAWATVTAHVISMECVLPDGQVIWVGGGGTKKIRKSSSGYRLKDLFMQHQGTLCIVTRAVLELYPKPEVEFAGFSYDSFADATKLYASPPRTRSLAGAIFDDKVDFLRRDDEAWIPLSRT
jgi:glycolate oxidase